MNDTQQDLNMIESHQGHPGPRAHFTNQVLCSSAEAGASIPIQAKVASNTWPMFLGPPCKAKEQSHLCSSETTKPQWRPTKFKPQGPQRELIP